MPRHQSVFSSIEHLRLVAVFAAITGVTLLSGCGGDSNLGDVGGVVTLNGEPLEGAYITFTPTQSDGIGTATYAKTGSDGTYRVFAADETYGAYIGENLVRIKTGVLKRDGTGITEEIIPNIYNSQSDLIADVKSGTNTFDFELESNSSSKIDRRADIDQ